MYKVKTNQSLFYYSEKHSNKVRNFILDMMSPLITEADAVSQELLDIILINIIEPYKVRIGSLLNVSDQLVIIIIILIN